RFPAQGHHKKHSKWEIFQTRFRSNMKNFFPILTLFVNGANGRDKQPKIKRHSRVLAARAISGMTNAANL
ncbi:MAG: hypothetical protein J6V32_00175, partial [Elusimicrobiaceae bacterium]|nr:hypothetical protein [Elusimicrobiaceae bacterium]